MSRKQASRNQLSFNQATDWFKISTDAWMLWGEASSVIWMRTLKMMVGGPQAEREAKRMVDEKVAANSDLAMKLATSGPATPEATATRSIKHYRTRVQANQRRLSRGG